MDDTRCRQFFLEPAETYHRQYEALRTSLWKGGNCGKSLNSLVIKNPRCA